MNSKTTFSKSVLKSSERKTFLLTILSRIRIEFLQTCVCVCVWTLELVFHFTYQWTVDVGGYLLSLALPLHTMKDLWHRSFRSCRWKHVAWYLALHKSHNESKTKSLLGFSYSQGWNCQLQKIDRLWQGVCLPPLDWVFQALTDH